MVADVVTHCLSVPYNPSLAPTSRLGPTLSHYGLDEQFNGLNHQVIQHIISNIARMPAHCFPNKSEPTAFTCPNCAAEYKVVAVEGPSDAQRGKIGCL
jgi:hypothetical protein